MTDSPLVSVVIPTYNRINLLSDAIKSVYEQTYKNIEIIVVDDGSTDATRQMVISCFPQVRYIYQRNQGVSVARNTGIRHAVGEFVAFLDSDDLWIPGKLEKQLNEFKKSPTLKIVAGNRIKIKPEERVSWPRITTNTKNISFLWLLAGKHLPTPSVIVRREVFSQVGYFNTNLTTGEDWDLWLRIVSVGSAVYLRSPVTIVRDSRNSLSKDRTTIYRNNIIVFDTWNPDKCKNSPINRFIYRLIVKKYFASAVVKLYLSGMQDQARDLWSMAKQTFEFKDYDEVYISILFIIKGVYLKWKGYMLSRR